MMSGISEFVASIVITKKGFSCKYPSCKSAYFIKPKNYVNKKFHMFPKNPATLAKWKEVCGISPDKDFKKFYICEDHFSIYDYVNMNSSYLKQNTFPKSPSNCQLDCEHNYPVLKPVTLFSKTDSNKTNTNVPCAEMNVIHDSSPNLSSMRNRKYSDASHVSSDLIIKIQQLDINDDGIKFNQKIKDVTDSWLEGCENCYEVEKIFDAIHQACLADGDLASKLVHLISSRTFLNQEIHGQNIRLMFIRKLQENFENCIQMQKLDPIHLRNCAQMMGEFYNKARLANGQQFLCLAAPLLIYLEMLLDSAEIMDLRLFTTLIYLNGSSLTKEYPETVTDILSKVRDMLGCNNNLTEQCRFWLLLAVEVARSRFTVLPTEIRSFYQQKLGDHVKACFKVVEEAIGKSLDHP